MLTWTQVYTPVQGSLLLSALVAVVPVAVLLGLLAFAHVRAHWAALCGLAASLAIAIVVYGMPPKLALAAAANGAAFGLLPIGWIILGAIFVYDIAVESGGFEVIKHTIAGLASDRRLQLLLVGFSFGAFIEGAAGFGTPVFRPNGATSRFRRPSSPSIHRGDRPSIRSAARRASSVRPSTPIRKASANCAPGSSAPVSGFGSTAWTFTTVLSQIFKRSWPIHL